MTDLPPLRPAIGPGLTDAECREVIVKRETLTVLFAKPINDLLVLARSKRHRDKRLGLAASEERGTVDLPGKDSDLSLDVPDIGSGTPIRSRSREDKFAFSLLGEPAQELLDEIAFGKRGVRLGTLFRLGADLIHAGRDILGHRAAAGVLAFGQQLFAETIKILRFELSCLLGVVRKILKLHLGLAGLGDELVLHLNDLTDDLMGLRDSLDHLLFGDFLCTAFDHRDGFHCSGNDEVKLALLELLVGGENNQLILDQPDSHRPQGAEEGNIGNAEGR